MKAIVRHVANSARAIRRAVMRTAPTGQVFKFDPNLDTIGRALTKGISISRLSSIVRGGDEGDITDALQVFEEMERDDPRLHSVANTRRLALTGLDWEVVSAADVQSNVADKKLAEESAAFVREQFDTLPGFDCALEHLSTAIGPNLAVLESVWEANRIADLVPIPHWRLTMDLRKSTDIRVITAEERVNGIVAEHPKFVVHIPNPKCGSPTAASLMRAQAFLWLIKKYSIASWAGYTEIFGMPIRVATYRSQAPAEDRRMLADTMKNLGTRAWGVFSEACNVQLLESPQRSSSPYEGIINHFNREQSILWLGGNLTSDTTGGTGTFAAATVQDEVRQDLRDDDIKREGRTIRDQLMRPMVELRFPGRDAPVPYFRRIKPEVVDRAKEAGVMAQAQKIGRQVPEDWARDVLAIPKPKTDESGRRETVLEPLTDSFGELPEGLDGDA